jgi:hypothetical protein
LTGRWQNGRRTTDFPCGLTGAEVLRYRFCLPGDSLAGILRLDSLALQSDAIARLDAGRITGESVKPFVLLVGHAHPVRCGDDTSRNRSLFGRLVNDHIATIPTTATAPVITPAMVRLLTILPPPALRLRTRREGHTESDNVGGILLIDLPSGRQRTPDRR